MAKIKAKTVDGRYASFEAYGDSVEETIKNILEFNAVDDGNGLVRIEEVQDVSIEERETSVINWGGRNLEVELD